jgi:YQGE family putative transporter
MIKRNHPRYGELDRESRLLLILSGLYAIATVLSGMFVNVYLWKIKRDIFLIGWFHLAQYVCVGLTSIFAGWMVKRVDRVVSIRLGVSVQAIFYSSVLFLGEKAPMHVLWLGALLGIGMGFFWLGYYLLYFEITERHNRDRYNGLNGLLSSLAGIIAPFVSGLIITRVDKLVGYQLIFALALGIFIAAVAISFFLKYREARGEFGFRKVIRQALQRGNAWANVSKGMIGHGLREGVFHFLIGLVVFIITKNELTLGTYFTVTYLVLMIAYALLHKLIKPSNRLRMMLIGAVMMGICFIPFVFFPNQTTIFVYGVGVSFFFPFYFAPLTAMVFDLIGENRQAVTNRVEYVVLREVSLNLGRAMGMLLMLCWLWLVPDPFDLRWFLFGLGFVQIYTWFALRRIPQIGVT